MGRVARRCKGRAQVRVRGFRARWRVCAHAFPCGVGGCFWGVGEGGSSTTLRMTWGGCDGGGMGVRGVEVVRSRRGPHPGPTMDTASGCGKTREGWVPDRGAVRRGRGVTAVGTALTSSGFVAEGVPTRALPWIPHRGAVRRGRGGYRIGVR